MDAVYENLHEAGRAGEPYIVKLERGDQLLVFFGCRHTNDAGDKQNAAIEEQWQIFINHQNKKKLALCEGGLRPYEPHKELAIEKYSEPGLLTWLANNDNIQLISPEPDDDAEVNYLFSQQFSVDEIMTYYFGRQMHQWLRADRQHQPEWKAYANHHISSYAKLESLRKYNLDLEKVLEMYHATTGINFSDRDDGQLYKVSAPTTNSVSAASGDYRNISLFKAIGQHWANGEDTFTLFGSGHAIVLEPALKRLLHD